MKLAATSEEQRRWVEQWKETGLLLEEIKRDELANLTDEQAWRQIERLQSPTEIWRDPNRPCGLLEQQACFQRARRK